MSKKSDLLVERDGVLAWLFDACFGRIAAIPAAIASAIFRLGTLNKELERDEE